MSQSKTLDSFDPFTTHPFTNTCGVVPRPPLPSKYSLHIYPTYDGQCTTLGLGGVDDTNERSSNISGEESRPHYLEQLHSPKPQRQAQPVYAKDASLLSVFVAVRKQTPTPELVLKKKPNAQDI